MKLSNHYTHIYINIYSVPIHAKTCVNHADSLQNTHKIKTPCVHSRIVNAYHVNIYIVIMMVTLQQCQFHVSCPYFVNSVSDYKTINSQNWVYLCVSQLYRQLDDSYQLKVIFQWPQITVSWLMRLQTASWGANLRWRNDLKSLQIFIMQFWHSI